MPLSRTALAAKSSNPIPQNNTIPYRYPSAESQSQSSEGRPQPCKAPEKSDRGFFGDLIRVYANLQNPTLYPRMREPAELCPITDYLFTDRGIFCNSVKGRDSLTRRAEELKLNFDDIILKIQGERLEVLLLMITARLSMCRYVNICNARISSLHLALK